MKAILWKEQIAYKLTTEFPINIYGHAPYNYISVNDGFIYMVVVPKDYSGGEKFLSPSVTS